MGGMASKDHLDTCIRREGAAPLFYRVSRMENQGLQQRSFVRSSSPIAARTREKAVNGTAWYGHTAGTFDCGLPHAIVLEAKDSNTLYLCAVEIRINSGEHLVSAVS